MSTSCGNQVVNLDHRLMRKEQDRKHVGNELVRNEYTW